MRIHDLLTKALEIREAADGVADPLLKHDLHLIAQKFERLALSANEDADDEPPAHSTSGSPPKVPG